MVVVVERGSGGGGRSSSGIPGSCGDLLHDDQQVTASGLQVDLLRCQPMKIDSCRRLKARQQKINNFLRPLIIGVTFGHLQKCALLACKFFFSYVASFLTSLQWSSITKAFVNTHLPTSPLHYLQPHISNRVKADQA